MADDADYGADVSTFPGLDPHFLTITGKPALAQRLVRRLVTSKGSLTYAPDDGLDVRAYLSRGIGAQEVSELGQLLETEILRDDEIESASALVTAIPERGSLTIRLSLVAGDGPFELVLSADKLTLEILSIT